MGSERRSPGIEVLVHQGLKRQRPLITDARRCLKGCSIRDAGSKPRVSGDPLPDVSQAPVRALRHGAHMLCWKVWPRMQFGEQAL